MNREGYAYPGQATIAKGARTSTRTVRRHIAEARKLGWLAVECAGRGGSGWRHNAYRAAVPDAHHLGDLDAVITDHVASIHGELWDKSCGVASRREDIPVQDVRTSELGAEDACYGNVRTELCPINSRSETLAIKTHTEEEALFESTQTSDAVMIKLIPERVRPTEPTQERQRVIVEKLLRSNLDVTVDDIARIAHTTADTVRNLRDAMTNESQARQITDEVFETEASVD